MTYKVKFEDTTFTSTRIFETFEEAENQFIDWLNADYKEMQLWYEDKNTMCVEITNTHAKYVNSLEENFVEISIEELD